MKVSEALRTRISTRAFKPNPVSESLLRDILDVARFAPSGGGGRLARPAALRERYGGPAEVHEETGRREGSRLRRRIARIDVELRYDRHLA